MRVLVTGGGGFIGSNLVEALLRRGDQVRVLDNFFTGRRENLADAAAWAEAGGGRYELLEGDIRSTDTVQAACREIDVVLHQAAIPSVSRSVDDPVTTNEVNVTGTLNLLMAARAAGVRRFVAASSSSLYGESPTLPKVETMMPAPISPYGLQKLTAETYLALFHRLYGLGTVALRYFNVFGPRQDPSSEYAAVIPRFVTRIAAGQAPTIYGDGKQTRDFTYIDNVVQANLRAAEASPEACGQAYNIACGERISLLELVEKINRVLGERASAQHEPARTGDIRDSLADIDKARRLLRYQPEVTLDQGIERTVLSLVGTTGR
jgi:nucleoside-diphosphate-sugar epimerase